MKKQVFWILLILWIGISWGANTANAKYASKHILVKLNNEAISRSSLPQGFRAVSSSFGINELDQILQNRGGTSIVRAHREVKDIAWAQSVGWNNWFIVNLDGRSSVEAALSSFKANRYVEEAQFDYILSPSAVPNDPNNGPNWGHNNTGSNVPGTGTAGFDAKAHSAWGLPQSYGNSNIIIAIIDTGVDTAHEDLRLMAGYDYGDNDSNPMDDSGKKGHGTACAGVAAAKANNGIGVAGIAGGCTVMPLKVANTAGALYLSAVANAITHAADNGARVISLSLGSHSADVGESPSSDNALSYAYNQGCVIFAATGNENYSHISYPANHQNVIAVGAASPSGQRKSPSSSDGQSWWGSSYGENIQDNRKAVDIMGPTILPTTDISGSAGYSTGNYSTGFNGTSCATPYVAGTAALLLSANPTLTNAEVRDILTSSATDMTIDGGTGWDRYTGYGMINAYAALLTQNNSIPQLQISSPADNSAFELGSTIPINTNAIVNSGSISKVEFFVDSVLKATLTAAPYNWNWDSSGYSAGNHQIKVVATSSGNESTEQSITLQLIAPADEGFESGNFSSFTWDNSSPVPWTVQSTVAFSGSYAAKSGAIGNNSTTELTLTRNVTSAGNISFFYKVSSETNYDKLSFLIDGVEKGSWSGTIDWTLASYPVNTGSHTFSFRYKKDVSNVAGSDCAWIDHINLPPSTMYFAPPQNLSALPADGEITLYWDAPNALVSSYQIYKDEAFLTSTTNTVYTDFDVVNGETYSYYIKAIYAGGSSEASASISVTAGPVYEAYLGTGTSATGTQEACPINIYYKSLHGQAIYTKAELNAQGITGPILLQSIGLDVASVPAYSLPDFVIRIKHTNNVNVSSWESAVGLQTVYGPATYTPQLGVDMLSLSTPFLWNGVDNILVDTAFSLLGGYSSSGTVRYTTVTNGYRFLRSDTANTTNTFSSTDISNNRPNLKMGFQAVPAIPELRLAPEELDFGNIAFGTLATRQLVLSNVGGGTLNIPKASISISGNAAFSLEELETDLALDGGQAETLVIKFQPQTIGDYSATLSISLGENRELYQVPLYGKGVDTVIRSFPYAENFDTILGGEIPEYWTALNNNNDLYTWAAIASNPDTPPNSMHIQWNASMAMDDYLITRPLALEAGLRYEIEFYYRVRGATYPENLRLQIGSSPTVAGLSTTLIDLPNITNLVYLKASVSYLCPESGIYYLAWHGYSEADNYELYFDTFSMDVVFDYPDGIPVFVGDGEAAITITVDDGDANNVPDSEIPAVSNPDFQAIHELVLDFFGAGPFTVSITTDILWAAFYQNGVWTAVPNSAGEISFQIDAAKAGLQIPIILGNLDPTLTYDYPNGVPITIGTGENAITITVSGGNANNVAGGEIPEITNGNFDLAHSMVLKLFGTGPWTINIVSLAPWGAYFHNGNWMPIESAAGEIEFIIDPAKRAKLGLEIPIVLGNQDPTLPVTLSSFSATTYAQNMVKIAWVAESETDHAGYHLYRSEVADLATALRINSGLISTGDNNGSQVSYSYLDSEVESGNSYYYWLESLGLNGASYYYGPISIKLQVNDEEHIVPEIPVETKLFSAFPNPFNPSTTLRYSLKEAAAVSLTIYNLKGQVIQNYQRQHESPGYYQLQWDGRDSSGQPVAAGVYFYRMHSGDYQSVKKMLLSK